MPPARSLVAATAVAALSSSAHAAVVQWTWTGTITQTSGSFFGVSPGLGQAISGSFILDESTPYVPANPGLSVTPVSVVSGFTLSVGPDTIVASDYSVIVQNQNSPGLDLAVIRAAGPDLVINGTPATLMGGPYAQVAFTSNTATPLTAGAPLDFPAQFDLLPSFSSGYAEVLSAQPGRFGWTFHTLERTVIPAPGPAGVLGLGLLALRRRRR